MLSPFKSKWGTCMFHSWIPGFNPENSSNLAFLTWLVLRRLPFEHHDQAIASAETLGEVIGMDRANDTAKDPRLCINLKVKEGWITSIALRFRGWVDTNTQSVGGLRKVTHQMPSMSKLEAQGARLQGAVEKTIKRGQTTTTLFPCKPVRQRKTQNH